MAKLTLRQQAAIDSRGKALIVSAAAGAGKTTVLVNRIIELVCDENNPVEIDRLLVVTFTNAAAAEMRTRIASALSERLEKNAGNRRLRRQLALLEGASIQTVHSFCGDLIRQNFAPAGVSPDFTLADDAYAQTLRQQAMEDLLEEQYAENIPAFEALRRNICEERGDLRLQSAIFSVYERLRSHPDSEKWLDFTARREVLSPENTPWGREILKNARKSLRYAAARVSRALDELQSDRDLSEKYRPALDNCTAFAHGLWLALDEGWDAAVAALASFEKPELGRRPKGSDPEFAEKIKAARDDFCERIEDIRKGGLNRPSDAIIAEERRAKPLIAELCRLVSAFSKRFADIKADRNVLDFSDLEHRALALLTTADGQRSELALALGERFCEVLVDEYQDTNEIQERIFRSVCGDNGAGFFVGDVKQSIYRFRLADPGIFLDRLDSSEDLPTENHRARLALSDNFRSLAPVLDICNHIFERIMSREFGDVDYDQSHRLVAGRTETQGGAELWMIDTAGLSSGEEQSEKAAEIEAKLACSRIVEILRGGKVFERDGSERAAAPSDFAILLSSYAGKAPFFANALRDAGIPVQSAEDARFYASVEINVLLSLLRVIDNPRQDIPLISALRSHLFLFDSDDLAFVRLCAQGDLFTALKAAALKGHEKSERFLRALGELREWARDLPVSALIRKIFRQTHAVAVFSALDGGTARARNLSTLYQMALAFEGDGVRSLSMFLRHIDEQIAAGIQPEPGASGDGVRIMSIHKAKGLEFPFVVLPDLGKGFNTDDTKGHILFHQHIGLAVSLRDERLRAEFKTAAHAAIAARIRRESFSEEMRKLYVAMTRAKQSLIMIMSGANLCKKLAAWSDESTGGPLEPEFLAARSSAMPWICAALRDYPGMCRPEGGCSAENPHFSAQIVAWDSVKTQKWEGVSLADNQPEIDREMLALAARSYPFETDSRLPSKLTPTGVRQLAPDAAELDERTVRFYRKPLPAGQLTAAERGTALHIFLSRADLSLCTSLEGAKAEVLEAAMSGFLSPEQAAGIAPEQVTALALSPLAKRMQSAEQCLHEYEFSALFSAHELLENGVVDEKIMLNGAIDLLIFTPEGIEIVDFKSDRVLPGFEAAAAQKHRRQLELYALAARRIFERDVARRTIWFSATGNEVTL